MSLRSTYLCCQATASPPYNRAAEFRQPLRRGNTINCKPTIRKPTNRKPTNRKPTNRKHGRSPFNTQMSCLAAVWRCRTTRPVRIKKVSSAEETCRVVVAVA